MLEPVPQSWRAALDASLSRPEALRLGSWLLGEEEAGRTIYPPRGQRLRAFELTPLDAVKVVILGQDPYHAPGQAHGLSFSVPEDERLPPSLLNIYKELESDLSIARRSSGNLEHWALQGVLLLNTSLTVEAGKAGSHAGRGWEAITNAALAAVAERDSPSVFILWGNHARRKAQDVPELGRGSRHLVLTSAHPSPLSAHSGFFGSKPFSKANNFLTANGRGAIEW
ncbi:uracil-DNA glycosylase [Tsuneonella sp. HG222]